MRKPVVLLTAMAGMLVACLMIKSGNAAPRTPVPRAETYSVVQIGDEVKVVKKSELAALKKSAAEDYKRAMKEYKDAKKEAAKNKDKSTDKPALEKPIQQKIVVKKTFKNEDEAKAWVETHLRSQKDEPKTGKSDKTDKTEKADKKAAAQ